MNRMIAPVLILIIAAVGCSMHGRYNPSDKYGDLISSNKNELVANLKNTGSTSAEAEERKVLVWGRELFEDSELGNNGQNCGSCHPGGGTTGGEATIPKKMGHGPYVLPIPSLVGAASRYPKYKVGNGQVITVQQMSNNCLRMFMAGKRLPLDSPESIALTKYVTSLSEGEGIDVGQGTQ